MPGPSIGYPFFRLGYKFHTSLIMKYVTYPVYPVLAEIQVVAEAIHQLISVQIVHIRRSLEFLTFQLSSTFALVVIERVLVIGVGLGVR